MTATTTPRRVAPLPVAPAAPAAGLVRPAWPAGLLATTAGATRRTLLQAQRNPQVLVTGLVRSAMFLLIFRYVFGGAMSSGVRYVDHLVPGFVTIGVLFSMMSTATAVAADEADGLHDRLRSLPVPRLGLVAGRVVADTALAGLGLGVTAVVGLAAGFRTSAPVGDLLGALALCLLAAFAFAWVFVTLGLVASSPQAAHGLALLVFPCTFVSSAFVPVASMPGWLQAVAANQPVTHLVDAVRSLALGEPGGGVLGAVLWCVAITAVFAPLAASRFDRR